MSFINGVGNIDQTTLDTCKKTINSSTIDRAEVSNYSFDESSDEVAVNVVFKGTKTLESEGKTKHFIAAQDGPDKGSKFYSDKDYDMFGRYKH